MLFYNCRDYQIGRWMKTIKNTWVIQQILWNKNTQPVKCCFHSGTSCIHSLTKSVTLEVSHPERSALKAVAPSNIPLYNCRRDYQRSGRCMKTIEIAWVIQQILWNKKIKNTSCRMLLSLWNIMHSFTYKV
jgi:hypothetical protein